LELHKPIEVWVSFCGTWRWEVYRRYSKPENELKQEYARWFCKVYSPFVPDGELGDVYVKEVVEVARKI